MKQLSQQNAIFCTLYAALRNRHAKLQQVPIRTNVDAHQAQRLKGWNIICEHKMHNDTDYDQDVIHYKRIILRMAAEETMHMYMLNARYGITVYDGFVAGAVDKPALQQMRLVCVDVPCCGKCLYTSYPT